MIAMMLSDAVCPAIDERGEDLALVLAFSIASMDGSLLKVVNTTAIDQTCDPV